ncbi:MFS transporter [Sulfurimonas sp.]|nr:MFS transporter [Sulfurimonas sp.]
MLEGKIIVKLSKAFRSIERVEVLPLTLLFFHSFLNGVALVFFETTANTLFLMEYDTGTLPYVYILTALVSVIFGYFYTKLEDNVTVTKLLRITMLFVIAVIFFFLVLIKYSDSKLAYMGIMVSKDLVWMFIGMEFGILTGMIFNIRQGKRLFGLLMSGEILAGILGGLSISVILNYIDTINLLFISTLTLAASFILLNYILNKYPDRFLEEDEEEELEGSNTSYTSMLKNKYYVLFFAVSILSFFIFYLIDYLFYYHVEANITDEKELASFFGVFYAVLNIVNLFSSLFISGTMLSRYGVIFGIMAIPLLAIIGTSSLIVTAMLSLGIGFIILITVKLLNEVLDISILNPTFKILYQSIPVKQRMKVLAFRETIIEPLSMGLAGVLLLGISLLEGVEVVYYVLIVMSVVWITLGKMLKEHYVLALEKLLTQREVFSDEFFLEGIDVNILLHGIKSDNDIEVIYCLDSLIKVEYENIDLVLKALLSHQSVKVRLSTLEYIDQLQRDTLSDDLNLRIDIEKNVEVLNKVLQLYCKFGAIDAIERLSKFVENKDILIQEGAIIGLLQFAGIDGVLVAGKVLNNLFESNDKTDKLRALNILAHMRVPSFYQQLKESLNNDDAEIKITTIKVIGNLKVKKLIPDLLKNLEFDVYRNVTVETLIKFQSKIFDDLVDYFKDATSLNSKYALIKVFSKMNTEKANKFLLHLAKDSLLCDEVFQRLFNSNFISKSETLIEDLILNEIAKILYYLNVIELLDEHKFPNSYLVVGELVSKKIENIFLILGFYYSKEIILQSILNYQNNSKDTRAYTVEVIDNMLSQSTKKIVLPILEDVSNEKKLSSYSSELFSNVKEEQEFIHDVLSDEKSPLILILSVVYELGKNQDNTYISKLEVLRKNVNPEIKQTATWTLKQLEKGV